MGRQLSIVATLEDERLILDFIRSTAKVRIFESFAATPEALWVDDFSDEFRGHIAYRIWNTNFPWTPTYSQVGANSHDPLCVGWYYVSNSGSAPVLEFSRSSSKAHGRLYWAKDFAAPRGLSYDVEQFSKWVDQVFRWIRKVGQRVEQGAYWFPSARRASGPDRQ